MSIKKLVLAHSFLYRTFKLPLVLNPIFNIGGLINSVYFNIVQPLICETVTKLHRASFLPV